VDEIVTRSRDYASIGGIALGALGAWLGWGLGAPTDDGQVWGIVGFASGAAVGAWAGSAYGKGFQSEENWYRAPTPPPAPPMDTAQKATAVADSPDELSPASLELAADIGPNDKLRVIGGFGRFQGYAHGAGPGGLDRLVADRDAPDDWNADALPPQIPWSAIDEVQMRRGNGGRGAVIGAVTFGLLGGLLAYGGNSALGGDVSTKDAVVIGGTFSALVGAALGAGVGAASRHWAVVYRRP
jgi:hypothetical protein